ncbi:MAG: penicillin-binding protein 2, partial [Propionibacteriaceae bacterium]|nr:penicillin-binding protein 2 [Propionibacteriaceae bacterium]
MNGPIRKVAIVVLAMFFALMANLTYANLARQTELNARPENRRVIDARFSQDRGPIMVGNTEIARSEESQGRFKYLRTYPKGELYAPVTGFYSYTYGNSGLEASMGADLSGADDAQVFDRLIKAAAGATPTGATVETTIDAKAQKAAWDGLDGRKGAVVALDFTTGAVKALVTSPSYDPSVLSAHDLTAVETAWKALNADPDQPMLNRATRNIYQPGSTFKLVTAAAALENIDGMTADTAIDASSYQLPHSTKTISGNCGGSKITLQQALEVSCNPGFARLGASLGPDAMAEQAEKFGFGQRFLTEIGSVASNFPTGIDSAQTAMSAIGEYETAATPL